MTYPRVNGFSLALALALMLGLGCDRSVSPPAPLPIEQLPAALEKAFSKAKSEARDLASQVIASLQAEDYSKAYVGLQSLAGRPGLNKEQLSVTTRGLLTVNDLLQSAQGKGDAKAAATLKFIRENK
jgi:hypothetical protein